MNMGLDKSDDDRIRKVGDLIIDTMQLNKVNPTDAICAMMNLVLYFFESNGISFDMTEKYFLDLLNYAKDKWKVK